MRDLELPFARPLDERTTVKPCLRRDRDISQLGHERAVNRLGVFNTKCEIERTGWPKLGQHHQVGMSRCSCDSGKRARNALLDWFGFLDRQLHQTHSRHATTVAVRGCAALPSLSRPAWALR